MKRAGLTLALALTALASSAPVGAQAVTVVGPDRNPAVIMLRDVLARPHALHASTSALTVPRDSAITTSLVVVGPRATLDDSVSGDVIVVGGDLVLHSGARVTGRAIAFGGAVVASSLAQVAGGSTSYRDETFDAQTSGTAVALRYRSLRAAEPERSKFDLAGLQGLIVPSYDRVNGLSFPVGVDLSLGDISLRPSLTYRSRLGKIDPRLNATVGADTGVHLEALAGRETRTNDSWIYNDLVNSLLTIWNGDDTRNYFRSNDVEGRLFYPFHPTGASWEPYIGGRYEDVSPVTATGDVFAIRHRDGDHERISRPNPLVEEGNIGSLLAGVRLFDTSGVVITRASAEMEQSLSTMAGTSAFTQITVDLRLGFPTFGTQRLQLRGHGLLTLASGQNTVPLARYSYLGGIGTLPVLDLLEMGGDDLFFLETRYLIPVDIVKLPMVGSPVLILRHMLGAAGVGSLPSLEQEIGVGIGVSAVHFDVNTDASHHRGTHFGLGISLSH